MVKEAEKQQRAPFVAVTQASLGIVILALAKGFIASGEWAYVADMSSLRICGYAPGHASVMGFFQTKDPSPGASLDVPLCPRSALYRAVESAKRDHGITFRIGFETEFLLLKSTLPIEEGNRYGWCESQALPTGAPVSIALEEMALAMEESGVEVEMYHAEGAPGQYEFVVTHMPPMEAVDALVTTRETIYNIAAKHGFRATLAPRLHMDSTGNAAHMHFSVQSSKPSPSANIPTAPFLTQTDASFLQSLLSHLPAICALSLPTDASYLRMLDGVWSGGTYAAWGRENREVPIRLSGARGNYHFELRCLDGTANAYVALAAILESGMRGIREGVKLEMADTQEVPASLSEEERRKRGIRKRLPLNRKEALEYFRADKELNEFFGKEFAEKYLAVNELLSTTLRDEDHAKEVKKVVEMY